MSKLYDELESRINGFDLTEEQKNEILRIILENKDKKANVLITGATGCGKSSTINAMFNSEKARVGTSPNPETMEITKYELNNLTLWDSPGLGDGVEADKSHADGIKNLLLEKDGNGNLLIDVVLVILDGSSRDIGTSTQLITDVIIPNLKDEKRLIVAINQADMAMKGNHWDYENHKPDEILNSFLEDKVKSIQKRIEESTGIHVNPVYYSAGYKEEGCTQDPPYNLTKLLYYIMESVPAEKRLVVIDQVNDDESVWNYDDEEEDYKEEIVTSVTESFAEKLSNYKEIADAITDCIPIPGAKAVGRVVAIGAAVLSTIAGGIRDFFGW